MPDKTPTGRNVQSNQEGEMDHARIARVRIMPDRQIGLPEDMLGTLGVGPNGRLAVITQNDQLTLMNPAIYAMKYLQQSMRGEAEKAGIESPEDVDAFIDDLRSGDKQKCSGLSIRIF